MHSLFYCAGRITVRLHRCAEIGCRELIKIGFSFCDKHYNKRMNDYHLERDAEKDLNSKTLRGRHDRIKYDETIRPELGHEFYHTKQWTKISQYIKQRDMYVDAIDGRGYDTGELIVDHIVPRRLLDTKAEQYDVSNLWLLNRVHHNHKTAIENKIEDNKLRHLSREWWINALRD